MIRVSPNDRPEILPIQSGRRLESAILESLASFREEIVAKSLVVDMEIASEADREFRAFAAQELETLLQEVITLADPGSELSFDAIETEQGIEIEVSIAQSIFRENLCGPNAQGQPAVSPAPVPAFFRREEPADSETQENEVSIARWHCSACPQGGYAWTLVHPHAKGNRKSRAA